MKNLVSIILVFVAFGYATAQDIQYVNAENGLSIREKPNRGAMRLALLDYGTVLEIVEHTNLKLDVMNNDEKLTGEWVKVRSLDAYDTFEGYVFNGFLTQEKLEKRFKTKYNEFTVTIDGLSEKETVKDEANPEFNDVLIYKLKDGESLEGKTVKVKHHQEFRSIEVFQKHENSIAISDDNSHCDMINWQHYYSSWKPLKKVTNNHRFKVIPVTKKEANRFIEIDIEELKTVVNDECGESWSASIENIESLNDYPVSVKVSKQYLRVLMTDIDGFKTEKIIIFEVPISNTLNQDSYAKL
jgi:hypothetical protein